MVVDCCSQLRTYEKFYGLLGAVCFFMCLASSLYLQRFDRFLKLVLKKHELEASNGRMLGDHLQQLMYSTVINLRV